MKFVIVTGMSGAGKTVALKVLEDYGYYCVDNIPVQLIVNFVELSEATDRISNKIALSIDIRSGEELSKLEGIFEELDAKKTDYDILFLDADDHTLIKRYKETRRKHPLAPNGRIESGISEERNQLSFIKSKANYLLDTSNLLTKELKQELVKIFIEDKGYNNMFITILSFGFMYGIPSDTDLLFDVRFLPNPYYEEEMRLKSGDDKAVSDYVFSDGTGNEFLEKLEDMIKFLIPKYIIEGKTQLVIAIGCTGGQHRSVAVTCELAKRLSAIENIGLKVEHRDIERNKKYIG